MNISFKVGGINGTKVTLGVTEYGCDVVIDGVYRTTCYSEAQESYEYWIGKGVEVALELVEAKC